MLLEKKSRETWLKEGDRNTKYFYITVVENMSRNRITMIRREDGSKTQFVEEVNEEAMSFFQEILNRVVPENRNVQDKILSYIPTIIGEEKKKALYQKINKEEVKKATFKLN